MARAMARQRPMRARRRRRRGPGSGRRPGQPAGGRYVRFFARTGPRTGCRAGRPVAAGRFVRSVIRWRRCTRPVRGPIAAWVLLLVSVGSGSGSEPGSGGGGSPSGAGVPARPVAATTSSRAWPDSSATRDTPLSLTPRTSPRPAMRTTVTLTPLARPRRAIISTCRRASPRRRREWCRTPNHAPQISSAAMMRRANGSTAYGSTISVTRTPKLSSTTTTSPLATRRPLTTTSTVEALAVSSTTLPGRSASRSLTVRTARPSSTVTSSGMSERSRMFRAPAALLPGPLRVASGRCPAPSGVAPVPRSGPRSGKPAGSTAGVSSARELNRKVACSACCVCPVCSGASLPSGALRGASRASLIVPPGGHAEPEVPAARADRAREQIDAADGAEGRLVGLVVDADHIADPEADDVAGGDGRWPQVAGEVHIHVSQLGTHPCGERELDGRLRQGAGTDQLERRSQRRDRVAETENGLRYGGTGEGDDLWEHQRHVARRDDPNQGGVALDRGEGRPDRHDGLERLGERDQEELEEIGDQQHLQVRGDPDGGGLAVPARQSVDEAQCGVPGHGDDEGPRERVETDGGNDARGGHAGREGAVGTLLGIGPRHAHQGAQGVSGPAADLTREAPVQLPDDADLLRRQDVGAAELEPRTVIGARKDGRLRLDRRSAAFLQDPGLQWFASHT